jgi:hypothetical protein
MEEFLVYSALLAIAALYRNQLKGKDKCEKRVEKLEEHVNRMNLAMVDDAKLVTKQGEERERLLAKLVTEVSQILVEQKDIIYRSIKILRRFDPDETPPPASKATAPTEALERKHDDETSAIFKTATRAGGR